MCNFTHREAAMVTIRPNVAWCDPCLAGFVRALFDAGFPTVASCCGHGRGPSRIALADGREVVIFADMHTADQAIAAVRHAPRIKEET